MGSWDRKGRNRVCLVDNRFHDTSDMTRTIAPLVKAKDAVYIDTTELGIQEVVDKILKDIE